MRFLSFVSSGKARFGALVGDEIVDLSARMPEYASLRDLIADDALERAGDIAQRCDGDVMLDAISYLPTIPDADRIFCIGVNYARRNEEYRDASNAPSYPSVFMRTRESLVGHLEPILRPPESTKFDYEGEIVMVVGKAGRRIARENARQHIAGLTLMNEGSVRDYMRHGKFNVTQGKNFESSGALGPVLITSDELGSFSNLGIETRVNGELRQQDSTENLMFSFEYLVSYLSVFCTLKPGDLISTGTPTGAGAHMRPPRYLVSGDLVEVSSPTIGKLANQVVDEKPH